MATRKGDRHHKEYTQLINCNRWKEVRNLYLTNHPYCEECQKQGITTGATEVHHIVPIESIHNLQEMEKMAYLVTNLQSLCHYHHMQIHQSMGYMKRSNLSRRRQAHVNRLVGELYDMDVEDIETWSPIPDFPGYEVSSYGRVSGPRGMLTLTKQKDGYIAAHVWKGKVHTLKVHILVATAFCDKPDYPCVVDHKDGDKNNNHSNNLQWITQSENTRKGKGRGKHPFNYKHGVTLTKDGESISFDSLTEACVYLGLNPNSGVSQISKVCRGIGKTLHGYECKFSEPGGMIF